MWKKALLTATVAGALAIGSTAAIAQTTVANPGDDAPTAVVQTQTRQQLRIQDPELMGTDAALRTQTRQRLQIHDPAEMGVTAPMAQERAQLQSGNGAPAGAMTQTRAQVQDPELCDGSCDGAGVGSGYGTGDCEGPMNDVAPADGTGFQHGARGGNS